MPRLALIFHDNPELYYLFESKDYFAYPYYGQDTNPNNCYLMMYGVNEYKQHEVSNEYVLGQAFVRQYGLQLIYSVTDDHFIFASIAIGQTAATPSYLGSLIGVVLSALALCCGAVHLTKTKIARLKHDNQLYVKMYSDILKNTKNINGGMLLKNTAKFQLSKFRQMRLDKSVSQ